MGTPTDTVTYTYGDEDWGDLLTAYDGQAITYDEIGNPLTDGTWSYTWQHGRQLASMTDGTTTWDYTYDANGLRTNRTDGTTNYRYVYDGDKLTFMARNGLYLRFAYTPEGTPLSVLYKGTTYYYVTNLQGDVTAILSQNGYVMVEYTYDAWGNLLTTTGSLANSLGRYNPLRYRGYVYDYETGLYYLQSRYYDPQTGRFLNADSQLNTSLGILGSNQFSYCLNGPVNMVDYGGNKPGDLFDTMDEAARDFAEYINGTSIAHNREYASYIYAKTVWETKTITYYNPNLFGKNLLSRLWNYIFQGGISKTVKVRVKTIKYTYVQPLKGTADSCLIPINWFGIHNQVALLHTHAAYSPQYANDVFSKTDKNTAAQRGIPSYIATPLGTLRRYNPLDGTDVVLFDDIPFDSNHPRR